ncbi:Rieske (2Fe-2S) protein [Streptomyces sp. NBC_01381]|uniref:Rieske (2Fe-2S) protein n=1 Tax=Streptomyces sp. NBC_01381 TaxID=2903845 RepID=UPI0022573E32|nr:Rieske (2Fe-2S) protein [Streptomyces sp. NBC_01381]MCX4668275.1 Rieske (2Fe-2S) protein [Streptomyces sp. NBC_01381]
MSGTPPTRRTVLATGGAVALAAGCSKYGDEDAEPEQPPETESSAAPSSSGGEKSQKPPAADELAKTSDIPVGGGKIFKDKKVVVTQPEEGDFKGFSAVCTHSGCTVSEVTDGTINCACHGSKYRVADASVAEGPAPRPLPAQKITVTGNSITLG